MHVRPRSHAGLWLAGAGLWLSGCASLSGLSDGSSGVDARAPGADAADARRADSAARDTGAPPHDAVADAREADRAPDSNSPPKDAANDGIASDAHEASSPDDATTTFMDAQYDAPRRDAAVDSGSRYAAAVMASSPLAYWRLGEPPDSGIAEDQTGGGNFGRYVSGVVPGAPGLITDDPNTAATFESQVKAGVLIGATETFDFSGTMPFTLEAWILPQEIPDATPNSNFYYPGVFARNTLAGAGYALSLTGTPSQARICFSRSAPQVDAGSIGSICAQGVTAGSTTPTYLVAVFDGSQDQIYVDGILSGAAPDTVAVPSQPNITAAIGLQQGYYAFSGVIDEVAVYSRALTHGEIAAHYLAGTSP